MIVKEAECLDLILGAREMEGCRDEPVSAPTSARSSECRGGESAQKVSRLLSKYTQHHQKKSQNVQPTSARNELQAYLQAINDMENVPDSAVLFWETTGIKMPKLRQLALRLLFIPASSAPVERVFSKGGLIMRPRRSRTSGKKLSHSLFLQCNDHFSAK